MTTQLRVSDRTIEELEHKLSVAEDTLEDEPSWQCVVDGLQSFLDDPSVDALTASKIVQRELQNAIDCRLDYGWKYVRPMVVDLARAGYYDDCRQPTMGRKIRERVIDGRSIPVGY